jgi:hypothetical protein
MRLAGYRLGFAGRCYVHHIGFGSGQSNGLQSREFYGRKRAALLHEKYPKTAAVPVLSSSE